jgi:hypothetical protein
MNIIQYMTLWNPQDCPGSKAKRIRRAEGNGPSRTTHFLDNRLTDGGEVVNLTHWPPITLRKTPGTHFCYRLSRLQGHSAAGRIRQTEKSNDLTGNRTRDLPACSIVPQLTTLSDTRWTTQKSSSRQGPQISLHRVQNGSGAHPASYPAGTGGSFPGGKVAGAW